MTESTLTSPRVAALVLGAVLVLVGVAVVASAQAAIVGMSVFAFAGALARTRTPLRRAFVVRRRFTDVTVLVVFAVVLAYLGLTTPLA